MDKLKLLYKLTHPYSEWSEDYRKKTIKVIHGYCFLGNKTKLRTFADAMDITYNNNDSAQDICKLLTEYVNNITQDKEI